MKGIATVTQGWWLSGPLNQWRRTTGVLRAHLLSTPLPAWMAPEGVDELRVLGELAHYRAATADLMVGHWGRRALVRVEIEPWAACGMTCVQVQALEPLPVSSWWLPAASYAECPPIPRN